VLAVVGGMEATARKGKDEIETKSFFGPQFRKWLSMKRALRLVQEEVHPEQIHVPRMRYKVRRRDSHNFDKSHL
jgi:hypothetical protein